jgi:hypothetical protein
VKDNSNERSPNSVDDKKIETKQRDPESEDEEDDSKPNSSKIFEDYFALINSKDFAPKVSKKFLLRYKNAHDIQRAIQHAHGGTKSNIPLPGNKIYVYLAFY